MTAFRGRVIPQAAVGVSTEPETGGSFPLIVVGFGHAAYSADPTS